MRYISAPFTFTFVCDTLAVGRIEKYLNTNHFSSNFTVKIFNLLTIYNLSCTDIKDESLCLIVSVLVKRLLL